MKITFTMYAPDGERFAPTAFDGQIGKQVPVLADVGVSQAELLEAKVAADGASAELTVEGDLRLPPASVSDFSFRREALRARHAWLLANTVDPILRALIEAHRPGSDDEFPDCPACPAPPSEIDGDDQPTAWPCPVWVFISDRMEDT